MGVKMKLSLLQKQVEIPTQDTTQLLPKTVQSICPECNASISAVILEKNNKIWMEKECEEHGKFKDLIYSDAKLYKKMQSYTFEDMPIKTTKKFNNSCNLNCGICNQHKSFACMTNIDLTNKCNLNCPICFANANKKGYVYELTIGQVRECLENIKKTNYPQKTYTVQFSGGEPTIHPQFLEILKIAKDLGFVHIQIASNGIMIANSLEFAKKCKQNGLYTVYLQFDGTDDKLYKKTRGVPLFELKKKVIENARIAGLKVVLVPTIVKTVNDNQIGNIFNFAVENSDVISGISFQPVSFCGRINEKKRLKQRFTLSDLALELEKQTKIFSAYEEFYPLSITQPFSKFYSLLKGYQTVNISCHPDCGIGTYVLVHKKTKEVIPLTKILDIPKFMSELNELTESKYDKKIKLLLIIKFLYLIRKNLIEENLPRGMTARKLLKGIFDAIKQSKIKTDYNFMIVAGMHFQDKYNFNLDRVKRCVIHYAAPNGMIYPFCAYNSGPEYREMIEKKFARKP